MPALPSARIVARHPLRYRRGADPALDRPAHVRAASGLAWAGDALIVVQDDALFVGVVELATGLVDEVAVPGVGVRTFDAVRGNKPDKPDLESAIVLAGELIAFGSGGPLPARQVVLRWRPEDPASAPVVQPLPAMFAALAACAAPDGALNLEGAAVLGDLVWLANRGGDQGRTRDRLVAVRATDLVAVLAADAAVVPVRVVDVALPALAGVALHLTDLAARGDELWCLAAAEATTSYFADGGVAGSALGTVDLAAGIAEVAVVLDERGAPAADKLEGLAFDRAIPDRAYAVTDPDDPATPGELLVLALR